MRKRTTEAVLFKKGHYFPGSAENQARGGCGSTRFGKARRWIVIIMFEPEKLAIVDLSRATYPGTSGEPCLILQ
jgi:hypothetical protein